VQNPFASLLGGMMAGGCQSMFGKGVVAFEPNALQWVAPDGHEEILNHVAFRANGQDVVMISRDPGAMPALFFGFPDHDHAVVAAFNCTMERLGARPPSVASVGPGRGSPTSQSASASAPSSGPANSVLNFSVGAATLGSFTPFTGIRVWVTPTDPEASLMRAGFPQGPGPLVRRLAADCHNPSNCVRDWKTMTSTALGSILTDAAGHARTPPIPAGHYYLVGVAPYQGKALFWRRPVNLQAGSNSVTLDPTNGSLFQ
jgi:hypothetical protein